MSLETPDKIRTLQRKLYVKAKAEPEFRFYLLHDKICRSDILAHAYALARSNAGAAGVDGTTFEDIERAGLEAWLEALREDLASMRYRPEPVRRVMIPKPGGGERPLGIPTIRDRVAQTAAKLVLEPIFEADQGCRVTALIRSPFCLPRMTWTASSSPRLTRCNTVWRETPSALIASRMGMKPSPASLLNRAMMSWVNRMRQGAPGVSCSPGMIPALSGLRGLIGARNCRGSLPAEHEVEIARGLVAPPVHESERRVRVDAAEHVIDWQRIVDHRCSRHAAELRHTQARLGLVRAQESEREPRDRRHGRIPDESPVAQNEPERR